MEGVTELLEKELLDLRLATDQVEVILSNLLLLQHAVEDRFLIPHEDLITTIQASLNILKSVR